MEFDFIKAGLLFLLLLHCVGGGEGRDEKEKNEKNNKNFKPDKGESESDSLSR